MILGDLLPGLALLVPDGHLGLLDAPLDADGAAGAGAVGKGQRRLHTVRRLEVHVPVEVTLIINTNLNLVSR